MSTFICFLFSAIFFLENSRYLMFSALSNPTLPPSRFCWRGWQDPHLWYAFNFCILYQVFSPLIFHFLYSSSFDFNVSSTIHSLKTNCKGVTVNSYALSLNPVRESSKLFARSLCAKHIITALAISKLSLTACWWSRALQFDPNLNENWTK